MNFADFEIVRPLAHTSHGPILLVKDPAGQFRTLRFLSLAEYTNNQKRIEQLQQQHFLASANIIGHFVESKRVGVICEYAQGQTLADLLLIPGAVKPSFANFIALRLKEALHELHEVGLFHGDLTPANIVISTHGQVKLIDFATVTGGTFGYREEGKSPSAETDLFAYVKICAEMGANLPVDSKPLVNSEVTIGVSDNLTSGAKNDWDGTQSDDFATSGLSPAALLRADLARDHTVAAVPNQVFRGRHRRPRRKIGVYLQQTFNLRVILGLTLLILGASSFGYWFQGSALENPAVQDIPAQNVLKMSESSTAQMPAHTDLTCVNQADAEAIVRSLLKQRNSALAQLDEEKLALVYAPESPALSSDLELFKRLRQTGTVVNGLRSEISNLQVKQCAEQVQLQLEHRLLEHEVCTKENCVIVPSGKSRTEILSLKGPSWRILKVEVLKNR